MNRLVLMIFPALTIMRKSFYESAKCVVILLVLAVGVAGCGKTIPENSQVSNVNFTPCVQSKVKSIELSSSRVDVEFTNEGVQITYYNFEVTCDFSIVNVTHTFVNGFLSITQQGYPNQADCVCYTDVSYIINGISQNEVNVVFINDVQVYCYNDKGIFKNCDKDVIISDTLYLTAPNDHVEIIDMKIEGNCLKIKFSASGCDGSSWNVKLIDSGLVTIVAIPIVGPPIYGRTLKLSLENHENCRAWITKEVSFNIEDLQIQEKWEWGNKIYLDILGKGILYEY